jgi:hypothetical protein
MKIIKSRKVAITPKNTSAGTQYWDIDSADDEAYIYKWLYRLICDMSELCTHDEEMRREWFKRRPGLYPKGKSGPNSHASIIGGICSAKLTQPNKNLSTPQLDSVEAMFDIIANYYSNEEDAPTSIGFDKQIYSIDPNPVRKSNPATVAKAAEILKGKG